MKDADSAKRQAFLKETVLLSAGAGLWSGTFFQQFAAEKMNSYNSMRGGGLQYETLSRFLDGELEAGDTEVLLEAMRQDPGLADEVARLQAVDDWLRQCYEFIRRSSLRLQSSCRRREPRPVHPDALGPDRRTPADAVAATPVKAALATHDAAVAPARLDHRECVAESEGEGRAG